MRGLATIEWRMWVRVLSALSLVLIGFAGQPLETPGGGLPNASAYAFPDGSIPVICVTLPGKGGGTQITHGLPCGACLVAGSIMVPTPAAIPGPSIEVAHRVAYARTEPPANGSVFPPSARPRAPPVA